MIQFGLASFRKGWVCIDPVNLPKSEIVRSVLNEQAAAVQGPTAPEKDISAQELTTRLAGLRTTLTDYAARHQGSPKERRKTAMILDWLNLKVQLFEKEPFSVPQSHDDKVRRGTVCWMEFGFNLGHEFGGRHPGLILRRSSGIVWVLPISSSVPTPEQAAQRIYVEIPRVFGNRFDDNIPRWINVLTLVPVSEMRIDYLGAFGHVKGPVLDSIRDAILQRGTR